MPRLRRVSPTMRGYTRQRRVKGFSYVDADAALGADDVERIKTLVIPPGWQDVWICPLPNGHIQATGVDAAGRPQYLYHPDWRIKRDAKYRADRLTGPMPSGTNDL